MRAALYLLLPLLCACPPQVVPDDTQEDTDTHQDPDDHDGDGYSAAQGDCDDADPTISPGADEVPYDGVDNDCAGGDSLDADGDGDEADWFGGEDCDDTDASIHPGAAEVCGDIVDQDCSGDPNDGSLDADSDGYDSQLCTGGEDCDDGDAAVMPGMSVSVPADFATPAAAVAAVCGGSTITVAAGTYQGIVDATGKALHLVSSAGAGTTILQGDGTGTVVSLGEVGGDSLVSGFTIRAGAGEIGGGIACTGTCTIEDSNLFSNDADFGGGIALIDADFSVTSCVFSGDTAREGAGIFAEDSTGSVTSCTFNETEAERGGGAISAWFTVIDVTSARVSSATAAQGGGFFLYQTEGAVTSSTFTTCSSESGGGVWSREATLDLVTNSFVNNYGEWGGAGYYCWDSTVSSLDTNTFSGSRVRDCDDYSTQPCVDYACRSCSGCE